MRHCETHVRDGRWVGASALITLAALVVLALLSSGCSGSDVTDETDDGVSGSPSTTAAVDGNEADFTEVAATMDAGVAQRGLGGAGLVIVERDDGVVYEHYSGDFDADRISLLASSSKMLTAGVLLHLADEGTLDMDAPVADVVDWGAGNPDITPAQLLSNSSGLIGLIDDPTFAPYLCQYLATGSLSDCARQIFTTTADDDQVVVPDSEFRYGGGQWQVAGAVAEAASGKPWSELIDEIYVEPCQLDSLGYNNHFGQITSDNGPFSYPTSFGGDPSTLVATDNPNMEGGAYASARDYSTLLLMQLRGGVCGDERVLSEASVRRMQTDRVVATYRADLAATLGGVVGAAEDEDTGGGRTLGGYGLGWWIDADDAAYVEDAGAFGSVPWLDLDRGYGAYLIVEATAQQGRSLAGELRPLIEQQIDLG